MNQDPSQPPSWNAKGRSPSLLIADMTLRGKNFFVKQELEIESPTSSRLMQLQRSQIEAPELPIKARTYNEGLKHIFVPLIDHESLSKNTPTVLPFSYEIGSIQLIPQLNVEPAQKGNEELLMKFDNFNFLQSEFQENHDNSQIFTSI